MGVVIPLEENGKGAASLQPLLDLTEKDMLSVNGEILARATSHVDMIPELANHLINSGGKRLRPMVTVAACRLCGVEEDLSPVKLAAAIEFMHTATLLHDDVVDESDLRRGKPAARMIWGNQASVLVGDYLLGQAFKMMVQTKSLECLRILSDAASVIAEGEVMQLAAQKDITTTEDAYMKIIDAKTAALFSAAAEVGAAVAERPREEQEALESFGRNLGIAFQLIDDALDYSGKQAELGKEVGDDFREGKVTLPVILSYRRGDEAQREFWTQKLEQGLQDESDLTQAISYLEEHGAIEATVERARHYGAIARDALAIFPESALKSSLTDAVDFCIERAH
ncbi:MAG: polyprenyl synthetase family protein [Hyphomicrobiales bacterium]